jgi:hypothetical protein
LALTGIDVTDVEIVAMNNLEDEPLLDIDLDRPPRSFKAALELIRVTNVENVAIENQEEELMEFLQVDRLPRSLEEVVELLQMKEALESSREQGKE